MQSYCCSTREFPVQPSIWLAEVFAPTADVSIHNTLIYKKNESWRCRSNLD